MKTIFNRFEKIDAAITNWMVNYSVVYLRISLSLIFIWFGGLKFFPDLSPTVDLIERTTNIITFGNLPTSVTVYMLASTECLIGICLLFKIFTRTTLLFLFLQMLATSTPIIFLPEVVFSKAPFALTIEGHHIVKNLILIGAGLVLGATVRGARFVEAS